MTHGLPSRPQLQSSMEICIIAAVSENMAIGRDGDMPWHIAEDLKFFKRTTLGCPVIMGRKTWLSLPRRPLPGRRNIVLTRGSSPIDGAETVNSLEEAYAALGDCEKCFILGGGSVYNAAIDDADTLYLTHIHATVDDADTFFPEPDMTRWEVTERSATQTDPETGYDFEWVTYRRIAENRVSGKCQG